MYKTLFKLLIFLLTITLHGQKTVLHKNFNPKAKELKHSLNKTRDSLMLSCEQNILKVDIFNEDFDKIVTVEHSEAQIPLIDMPLGEFVIEVKLEDKTIVMEMVRFEYDESISKSDAGDKVQENGTMLDENMNAIPVNSKNTIENLLSPKKSKKTNTVKKFFWVILKIHNKSGSSKTMKLVDQNSAEKLIKRNKMELRSTTGKFNELKVWEVYDASKFMRAQLADSNYIHSTSSELFNVKPYYSTTDNRVAVQLK